ncbi:MAG: RNA polymerase sigma factor [Acidobacteria bacterium]|nr:RNA polymerase sigma factor [Acidobacteriota bacterium]
MTEDAGRQLPPPGSDPSGPGREEGPASGTLRASPEDRALVNQLLAGDESAFATFVGRYHNHLLRLALFFVSDSATAEEVVQETWLGLLRGLRSFEGRSSLKTWLFRILVNQARTRGAREGRRRALSAPVEAGDPPEPAVDPHRFGPNGAWVKPPRPWAGRSPEDRVLQGEALVVLRKAISELPPNQRAVVTLRDLEELTSEEVCNALDISETNQRVLLHRGRSRLRRALEQHFGVG